MSSLIGHLRLGLRLLKNSPGFASIAILAFALGIGANTAIFSVVNAVLLRPLNYSQPERLFVLEHAGPSPVAPATFLDWQSQSTSFDQIAAAQAWGGSLRGGERPEALIGLRVTANMFSLLGSAPQLGRTFQPGEDQLDSARDTNVAVISHSLWQRSLGGAPDVLGRKLDLDGVTFTVIGVMPPSFQFAPYWVTNAEIWAPLEMSNRRTDRAGKSLRVFARLKSGVTVEQARSEMSAVMARIAAQFPDASAGDIVTVTSLQDRVVGGVRTMLLVLLGTVSFVLMIACANVASLMLARATGRRRDFGIRVALGASKWQLAMQSLAESAVLATLGGITGLLLADSGVRALTALLPAGSLPRQKEVAVDVNVFLFAAALALATGIVAALLPAWHSSRSDVNDALKDGGRSGSAGRATHRTRSILVAGETALAFVLLMGAGLMIRSFVNLLSQNPGFDSSNLLTFNLSVAGTRQMDGSRRPLFYREALDRIASVPGVTAASATNHSPITGDVWGTRFRVEGRPEPAAGEWPGAVFRVAFPGYFATMRTGLVRGRDFADTDNLQSRRVVIVNESLARTHFAGQDPIGKRIAGSGTQWSEIVGVVRDIRQTDLQTNPRAELYYPFLQSQEYLSNAARQYTSLDFVVRVNNDPAGKSAAIRRAIESVDPSVLVSNLISMERAVSNKSWRPRMSLFLLAAFAAVALVLAVTGIYGVISHAVSQRVPEIGVRIALGATRREVLMQAIARSMPPLLLGIAAGATLAVAFGRLMSTMLYGVQPSDPITCAASAALMLAAGLFAAFWPALRAARVDPIVALRHS